MLTLQQLYDFCGISDVVLNTTVLVHWECLKSVDNYNECIFNNHILLTLHDDSADTSDFL